MGYITQILTTNYKTVLQILLMGYIHYGNNKSILYCEIGLAYTDETRHETYIVVSIWMHKRFITLFPLFLLIYKKTEQLLFK